MDELVVATVGEVLGAIVTPTEGDVLVIPVVGETLGAIEGDALGVFVVFSEGDALGGVVFAIEGDEVVTPTEGGVVTTAVGVEVVVPTEGETLGLPVISTVGTEKQINLFLRVQSDVKNGKRTELPNAQGKGSSEADIPVHTCCVTPDWASRNNLERTGVHSESQVIVEKK